jgi:hypothetical protein
VALRWYLPLTFAANPACQTAQLPLCTLWRGGSAKEVAVTVDHSTDSDMVIALSATLVLASVTLGETSWPISGFARVAITVDALTALQSSRGSGSKRPSNKAYTNGTLTHRLSAPASPRLLAMIRSSRPSGLLAARYQVGTVGSSERRGP